MLEIVRVASKAVKLMLQEDSDLDLILMSYPGSSGARVSIFRHPGTFFLYAVKCVDKSRISLKEEAVRKAQLSPYIEEHLPKVLWEETVDGYEVMISECRGLHNLHSLILNGDIPYSILMNVWNSVTETFQAMWEKSRHDFDPVACPRYLPSRHERVASALYENDYFGEKLAHFWAKPVIINGREYLSLDKSFKVIQAVKSPNFGVICHGDPLKRRLFLTKILPLRTQTRLIKKHLINKGVLLVGNPELY